MIAMITSIIINRNVTINTEKPVILARACSGNAKSAGRLALRKLEKKLPPGRVWPNGH